MKAVWSVMRLGVPLIDDCFRPRFSGRAMRLL
jgi:hypothetical protein